MLRAGLRLFVRKNSDFTSSKSFENLRQAFYGESAANRRYLFFAQRADVEGHPEVAALFRSTADGETGHAFGHLEFMEGVDPATMQSMGNTLENLQSAHTGEVHEYENMYPGMARTADEEGYDQLAEWFRTLALAEKSHAGKFLKAFNRLKEELDQ